MSLTLGDYRTRIQTELNLSGTDAGTEENLVDSWVNEGVLQFVVDTECKVTTAEMTLTANVADYDLPAGVLVTKKLVVTTVAGNDIPLEPVDNDVIDWLRAGSVSGSDPAYYAIDGNNLLRVYPTPTSAGTITVRYVPAPATLDASGEIPTEIPAEWQPAVEAYAKWKAQLWLDNTSPVVDRYRAEYEGWVKKARRGLTRRRGPWGAVKPRRGRLRMFPTSNGVDYGA